MADLLGMGKQPLLDKILGHVCKQYRLKEDQVIPMLQSFISVLQGHMGSLEAALATGDIVEIGRKGHALKGALLNLGLFDIAILAESIESAAKNGGRNVNYTELVGRIQVMLGSIL